MIGAYISLTAHQKQYLNEPAPQETISDQNPIYKK